MAKALIGHLPGDVRSSAPLVAENHRLRTRVNELEVLVLRLQQENDRLTALQAAVMLEDADLAHADLAHADLAHEPA